MKLLFTFINIFLLMIIGLVAYAHFSMEKSKPEPVLKETPENPSLVFDSKNKRNSKPTRISAIWQNNLFEPLRGKEASDDAPKEEIRDNGEMELIGIFRFGKVEKAIILLRSGGGRVNSSRTNRKPYGRLGRRPRRPAPTSTKQETPQKSYSVGDRLSNGYELKEIHDEKVVLVRGDLRRELKLEYDDGGSSSRTTESYNMAKKKSDSFKAGPSKKKPERVKKNKLPTPPRPPGMKNKEN